MVKPTGSILAFVHSLWPITEAACQPWARQIAAALRAMASSCTAGHGSLPSPMLMHSKP
jgi:hypothetical protein